MADTFLLDLGRCIGCQACTAACKTGNQLAEGTQFISLIEQTRGEFPDIEGGFRNHRCYHCADAACVSVCPTGALFKEGGLTRTNRDICSGCGYCVEACPFGVPEMVDGLSSKCDGCADTVRAGGQPWCVQTCPSNALVFGRREEIIKEARERVSAMRVRYTNAQVYGETEAGGLGVVMVLPDEPDVLDLPVDPAPPPLINFWTGVIQPTTLVATAGATVAAGVMGVIARRNHMLELKEIEEAEARAADASQPTEGEEA